MTPPPPSSSAGGSPGKRPTAAQIEAIASDWVIRSDAHLDAASRIEREAWRAADPAHEEAFSRLAGTWKAFDRAEQRGVTSDLLAQLQVRKRRRRVRRKAGAALVGCLLFGVILASWSRTSRQTIELPPESTATFVSIQKLPDGTLVELNQDAQLAVRYEANLRRVQLIRGEALFRVQKDPHRPFLVEAGHVGVGAVGTAFNVQLRAEAVEILVTEGRVRITDSARGTSLLARPPEHPATVAGDDDLLVAGEHATVDLTTAVPGPARVARLDVSEMEQKLAWRIPRLEFEGMPLHQAVALINQHNRLQISLGDPAIGRHRISGAFRSDNPEGFVHIVEAAFGLRAERPSDVLIVLKAAP